MTIIGKHTEAANKAIERAAGYPGDDPATAAARIVLAFAHELDATGDVDLLQQIRRAVRVQGGNVQTVLGADQ